MRNFYVIIILISSLCVGFAQETETRSLGAFQKIRNSGNLDVFLSKGDKESARLEISGIELERIATEVENGVLKIFIKKNNWGDWGWNNNVKGKVYVTYRNLDGISNSGSGDISGETLIEASDLNLSSSGSGDMYFSNLKANSLDVSISGSSNITLKGSASSVGMSISGSGDLDASGFKADKFDASVSGSGNIQIHVNTELRARVSGSGDIVYTGSPEVTDLRTSGSGRIRKIKSGE